MFQRGCCDRRGTGLEGRLRQSGWNCVQESCATRDVPETPLSVEWTVEGRRGRVGAKVVDLPFLDLPRKRA